MRRPDDLAKLQLSPCNPTLFFSLHDDSHHPACTLCNSLERMAADVTCQQDQASQELVRSLARLPTSELVRFTLQKPDVARIFALSLNSLAIQAASTPLPGTRNSQLALCHVDILARLVQRGDPSLARKFVPTQGSLLDLAVASPPGTKAVVSSVLERLLDATSVKEILAGLSAQLNSILAAEHQQDVASISATVRTLARLSSAFIAVCPARLLKSNTSILQAWTQACLQLYDRTLPQLANSRADSASATALQLNLSQLDASSWQLHWLTCRVDLLQLIAILLDKLRGSSAFVVALRDGLIDTESLLKRGGFSTLLNSTALLDLAATSDLWPSLRSELRSSSALKKTKADETLSSIDTLATSVPKFTGAAWDALQHLVTSQDSISAGRSRQQKKTEPASVSDGILASVDSILPHYGLERLRKILSRPSFAGLEAEMIIQRLLEGDEAEADPAPSASLQAPAVAEPGTRALESAILPHHQRTVAEPSSSSTPSLVKSRANLFGEFGFDPATIVQPKLSRSGKVDELAPALKAAILARAEAADDDEGEEEWNPFAELHRTVGVEDELNLDYDGRERSSAPHRAANDDDDGEDEEGADDAAAARMRERMLLRHYVQFGSGSFASNVATRRSESRQRLKEQTGWSDDLIESWGVMLERNPKKDRLLAAASQSELDEQLLSQAHSRNLTSNEVDEDAQTSTARRWGPDRGRGGRILGGGARGGHRAQAPSGGTNSGSSGHHHTKNATRGRGTGNSATDRSAKHKEKAGNKARQKGHDKKMARVNT